MKSLCALAIVMLPCFAFAANEPKKEAHHGTRLGACSKEAHAKGLKGAERKKFISTCASSTHVAKAATSAAAS